MSRDTYIFGSFVAPLCHRQRRSSLAFGRPLCLTASGFGTIVAAGFTLFLYSFLYKDNPLFKFGEHVYVGAAAAAYVFGQVWFQVLYRRSSYGPVFYAEDGNAGSTLHLDHTNQLSVCSC